MWGNIRPSVEGYDVHQIKICDRKKKKVALELRLKSNITRLRQTFVIPSRNPLVLGKQAIAHGPTRTSTIVVRTSTRENRLKRKYLPIPSESES